MDMMQKIKKLKKIIQYELSDGSKENIAQFEYKDVFYILNTTMEEEEFKKILKNLYFF